MLSGNLIYFVASQTVCKLHLEMDSNGFKGECVPGDVVMSVANISLIIDLKQEHSQRKEKCVFLIAQLLLLETENKWMFLIALKTRPH